MRSMWNNGMNRRLYVFFEYAEETFRAEANEGVFSSRGYTRKL